MGKEISVTIKFFSGIDGDLKLDGYDPSRGISLKIPDGRRLRGVLRDLGLRRISSCVYFREGGRIGAWSRLRDGDEVSCLKPSGGG